MRLLLCLVTPPGEGPSLKEFEERRRATEPKNFMTLNGELMRLGGFVPSLPPVC